MTVIYIGSRKHISQSVKIAKTHDPLLVVDAVTLNREEIDERISKDLPDYRRLFIRPVNAGDLGSERVAEYEHWLKTIESKLRRNAETQTLSLARTVDDWQDDIAKSIQYGTFHITEPGTSISLISREEKNRIVREAVEHSAAGIALKPNESNMFVPTDALAQIFSAELNRSILFEQVKPDDLYRAMVDTGMSPILSDRVVAAQQLVVSKDESRRTQITDMLDDFGIYISSMKGLKT